MKKSLALAGLIALCAAPDRATRPWTSASRAGGRRRLHVGAGLRRRRGGARARRQRRRRRGGHRLRAGRDAPVGRQHRRRRLHDRPHAGGQRRRRSTSARRRRCASTPTMYLGADGSIDRSLTAAGYLAPGVPGTVRGLEPRTRSSASCRGRTSSCPACSSPSRASCSRRRSRAASTRELKRHGAVSGLGRRLRQAGGGEWAAGDRLVLTDLGRTLRAIADDGPDAFYKGWIADRIAEDMKANGGLITKEDLAAYQAKERAPVRGTYRGFEIVSMPPPSSGGVALIEMLNILEPFDLKCEGAADRAGAAPADRSDAPRLSRSRPLPRRSGLRRRSRSRG